MVGEISESILSLESRVFQHLTRGIDGEVGGPGHEGLVGDGHSVALDSVDNRSHRHRGFRSDHLEDNSSVDLRELSDFDGPDSAVREGEGVHAAHSAGRAAFHGLARGDDGPPAKVHGTQSSPNITVTQIQREKNKDVLS